MKIYHIAHNYRRADLWEGTKLGERIATHTCTPRFGLTAQQRYDAIADWLVRNGVLATPSFEQPKRRATIRYT